MDRQKAERIISTLNTISDDALGKLFRALLLLEIKKRLETKSTETKSANE